MSIYNIYDGGTIKIDKIINDSHFVLTINDWGTNHCSEVLMTNAELNEIIALLNNTKNNIFGERDIIPKDLLNALCKDHNQEGSCFSGCEKELSRQRRWQIRMVSENRCSRCAEPIEKTGDPFYGLCNKCGIKRRQYLRIYRGCKPRTLNGVSIDDEFGYSNECLKITNRYKCGESAIAIAKDIGCSPGRILNIARYYGAQIRRRGRPKKHPDSL